MIYFTSDPHYGHTNILKYSNRPFDSIEEHDETLIKNWNNVVTHEDVVYILGDFAFSSQARINSIINRLNFAHIHFIKGNHEKPFCEWYRSHNPKNVTLYGSYLQTKFEGKDFTLCHFPVLEWDKCHRGAYHLYGHVHNNPMPEIDIYRAMNVGVDIQNFTPISLNEVFRQLDKRQIKTHH